VSPFLATVSRGDHWIQSTRAPVSVRRMTFATRHLGDRLPGQDGGTTPACTAAASMTVPIAASRMPIDAGPNHPRARSGLDQPLRSHRSGTEEVEVAQRGGGDGEDDGKDDRGHGDRGAVCDARSGDSPATRPSRPRSFPGASIRSLPAPVPPGYRPCGTDKPRRSDPQVRSALRAGRAPATARDSPETGHE
jgi:hypothetical protein